MKKTYNINISGYGFVIDEDAFDMLDKYLTTLTEVCTRSNDSETAADIEERIAEIFSEKLRHSHRTILTLQDVEEVIGRMGRPEDILEVEVEEVKPESTDSHSANQGPSFKGAPIRKRLFRDPENRVFGGVCSGLGWYLNIDPVWIRIIMVVLTLFTSFSLVLIYLILWLCIPAARTPYQRMEMMGMNPSMNNVGKVVTGAYNSRFASNGSSGPGRVILMIVLALCLLVTGALLFSMILGALGCIVALCVTPFAASYDEFGNARLILGCVTGGLITVGVPLFLLFRYLITLFNGRNMPAFSTPQWILILILWFIGIGATITCACLL